MLHPLLALIKRLSSYQKLGGNDSQQLDTNRRCASWLNAVEAFFFFCDAIIKIILVVLNIACIPFIGDTTARRSTRAIGLACCSHYYL